MQVFGFVGFCVLFGCTGYGGFQLWRGWRRYRATQQRRAEDAALLVLMAERQAAHQPTTHAGLPVYDLTTPTSEP